MFTVGIERWLMCLVWLVAAAGCRYVMPRPQALEDPTVDRGPADRGGADLRLDTAGPGLPDYRLPTTASLKAVWGSHANAVWAVGNGGTILRWDGQRWSKEPSPTSADLNALWGTAAGEVWSVGDAGTLLRLAAGQWQAVASPVAVNLTGIWGAAASDLWAVGSAGTLVHHDGSSWVPSKEGGEDLYAIWGRDGDDIWVTGDNGTLLHYGGAAAGWSAEPPLTTRSIRSIWGTTAGATSLRIYAATAGGAVLSSTGGAWSTTEVSATVTFRGTSGVPAIATADQVWAVGDTSTDAVIYALESGSWTLRHTVPAKRLFGVWGSSSGTGWAVGEGLVIPLPLPP